MLTMLQSYFLTPAAWGVKGLLYPLPTWASLTDYVPPLSLRVVSMARSVYLKVQSKFNANLRKAEHASQYEKPITGGKISNRIVRSSLGKEVWARSRMMGIEVLTSAEINPCSTNGTWKWKGKVHSMSEHGSLCSMSKSQRYTRNRWSLTSLRRT